MDAKRNCAAEAERGGSADGGSSGNSGFNNRKRKKPWRPRQSCGFQCESRAAEKINKLLTHDDAYMDVIMQMIQDYGNIQVDDEEEMEFDIDNLNVNCLNELGFVTKSNNDIRRKNAKERAKQRRNERRRQERARKLREQQEEAEQQRMQQRQQQMQMSSNISMFGNPLVITAIAYSTQVGRHQHTAKQDSAASQNTSAPPQQKQQAYVESDEDNDEALASGATGNFDAEFETSNDNLWSQMGAGSQSTGSGASKPQPAMLHQNTEEEEILTLVSGDMARSIYRSEGSRGMECLL